MSHITALIAYVQAHQAQVIAWAGAVYTALSIINGKIQNPQAKTWVGMILDALSFISRAQARDSVKAPFTRSKPQNGVAKLDIAVPNKIASWPVFWLVFGGIGIAAALSGCVCWQPAHVNDQACIIARQSVDCTENAAKNLAPAARAIVEQAIASGTVDWGPVLLQLGGMAVGDVGCILADLIKDYSGKAKASPEMGEKLKASLGAMANFKRSMGIEKVKFCVKFAGGRDCR